MEAERVAETLCSMVFFRISDGGQSPRKTLNLKILQVHECSFSPKVASHPLETTALGHRYAEKGRQ
jgi:hypothetical protein